MSDSFEPKFYRKWASHSRLQSFIVQVEETDLAIKASVMLRNEAKRLVVELRQQLLDYGEAHPRFFTSMEPLADDEQAPEIVKLMLEAGSLYEVGPMAAVAGTVAEAVGRGLLEIARQKGIEAPEVIVENGGDCFLKTEKPALMVLYAGADSPFSGNIKMRIETRDGCGVCTSSGTFGHSTSFGKADAVVAVADSAALADAAATAICNKIQKPEDIQAVIEQEKKKSLLRGVLITMGNQIGAWGEIEIV